MHRSRRAFSLVELSIVLVILGLLTGGILGGQALIKAAEMRKITNAYTQYETAAFSFRDKYFQLPGDLNNATAFWPTAANGNADGQVAWWAESIYFWQHLANAGLIAGTYAIPAGYGADAVTSVEIGVSHPPVVGNYGMHINYGPITTAGGAQNKNWMAVGHDPNAFWFSVCSDGHLGCLLPQDTWNIDSKMDDGKPMTGKMVLNWTHGACLAAGSVAGNEYALDGTNRYCTVMMGL